MQARSRIAETPEVDEEERSIRPYFPVSRRFLAKLARSAEEVARHAGQIAMLGWRIVVLTFTGRVPLREFLGHMYWMGIQSLPIVLVTSTLAGVVTSQQGGYQFTGSVPLYILGSVVASSVILELGPVLTAVVLIGRVGARITAELGTMQVSEQIDAMYSLGRDPVRVLAAPRVLAGAVAFPLLVAIANTVGLFAGMVAARGTLGLSPQSFLYGARLFWHNWDLFYSLSKATSFGLVIPLIATHMGLVTRGGAEGVGRATTSAVVFMLLAVLFLDALFPPLMLQ
ncbi:MAG: ABC transporter permease [Gemmatimonadetes bacterium]|nr:ABC transporter permease [Gemmatimonadota bacterium]